MINLSWRSATHNTGNRDDIEERNRVSSYRGYLYKMRRSKNLLAPQWGKRWLSIEGHFLKWYRTESDLNASGMVDLKYVRSITKVEHVASHTFMLTCEERTLILRCASAVEMNGWIRALHMHADIARGGSGMMVVSDFNQRPLNSAALRYGQKNRKLRASLTLEQELDQTMKRLNELEKELHHVNSDDFHDDDIIGEPKATHTRFSPELKRDKRSSDSDGLEDSIGSYSDKPVTIRQPKHSAQKPARNIHDDFHDPNNDTSYALNPTNYNTGGQPTKKSIRRLDSSNSIEDINFQVRKAKTKSARGLQMTNNNNQNYGETSPRRSTNNASENNRYRYNSRNQDEELLDDEFEFSDHDDGYSFKPAQHAQPLQAGTPSHLQRQQSSNRRSSNNNNYSDEYDNRNNHYDNNENRYNRNSNNVRSSNNGNFKYNHDNAESEKLVDNGDFYEEYVDALTPVNSFTLDNAPVRHHSMRNNASNNTPTARLSVNNHGNSSNANNSLRNSEVRSSRGPAGLRSAWANS